MRSTLLHSCVSFCVLMMLGAFSSVADDENKISIKSDLLKARVAYRDTLKLITELLSLEDEIASTPKWGRRIDAENALRDAELALPLTDDERSQVLQESLKRFQRIEREARDRFEAGFCGPQKLVRVQIARGNAELFAASDPDEKRRIWDAILKQWRKLEVLIEEELKLGTTTKDLLLQTQIARREAELTFASTAEERSEIFQAKLERRREIEIEANQRYKVGILLRVDLIKAQIARGVAESAVSLSPVERNRILKANLELARQLYTQTMSLFETGTLPVDEMVEAINSLRDAELAIALTTDERIKALEANLDQTRFLEVEAKVRLDVGIMLPRVMQKSTAARMLSEIMLLEEKDGGSVTKP